MNIAQLLNEQADLTPRAIAIEDGTRTVSYAEMALLVHNSAKGLVALGVKPGVVVAIQAARNYEYVIAVCATLLAGGLCAPLDPKYPADRVRKMLADAAPALVLTVSEEKDIIARAAEEVSLPIRSIGALRTTDVLPLPVTADDDIAYLLYTSGSTGSPKGVEMPHGPIVRLARWHQSDPRLGTVSRCLLMASLSFDVSFQEIFSTFATGGTLVIPPDAVRADFGRLFAFVVDHRIERLFLPTAALALLAAHYSDARSELRDVICAGEQLVITPAIRHWFRSMPLLALHNHYGPTETHVVTTHCLPRDVDSWPSLPPIGKPLPHVEVILLNAKGEPCEEGQVAEIVVGGGCVARGYRNHPDETRERFLAAPSGDRRYRTGDLAVWRSGELHYLGRSDRQTKIDGYRVELGEIEAVLLAHPAVTGCAVQSHGPGEDRRLIAYIVGRNHAAPPAGRTDKTGDWATYLRGLLPDFMIPRAFILLPELPLSTNGKIDRDRLPPPPLPQPPASEVSGGRVEEVIARVWADLLGCSVVDRDSNFFDLGGTSLMAARARVRISAETGIAVDLVDLFAAPTVHALAAALCPMQEDVGPQIARRGRDALQAQAARRRAARARYQ